MDSSSYDSGEERIDDNDEEEETHETGTIASNCSRGNSSRQHRPRSVVWKFFSALQGRKSVQCQLCPVGNNDGLLAYHGETSSICEHLKRRHYSYCIL